TSYRWTEQPYWYRESDGCTYIPPFGRCKDTISTSGILYWRVTVSLAGQKRAIVSRVGKVRLVPGNDRRPPSARAEPGSARYRSVSRFYFFSSDDTGLTREHLDLYLGDDVVYRARDEWSRVIGARQY